MFGRVLLPVDLSERGADATRRCAAGVGRNAESVILLHVVETISGDTDEELDDFYQRLREKAVERLRALTDQLVGEGITARQEVVLGQRGPEIVRFAREEDVDLILLSSHTVDPAQPGGLGSISHQVALFAPCSVLLLR